MTVNLIDENQRELYFSLAHEPLASAAFGAVAFLDLATNDPTRFDGGPEHLEFCLEHFGKMSKFEFEAAVSTTGLTSLTDEQHTTLQRVIESAKVNLREWHEQQKAWKENAI